jgi:hypothetical protein
MHYTSCACSRTDDCCAESFTHQCASTLSHLMYTHISLSLRTWPPDKSFPCGGWMTSRPCTLVQEHRRNWKRFERACFKLYTLLTNGVLLAQLLNYACGVFNKGKSLPSTHTSFIALPWMVVKTKRPLHWGGFSSITSSLIYEIVSTYSA